MEELTEKNMAEFLEICLILRVLFIPKGFACEKSRGVFGRHRPFRIKVLAGKSPLGQKPSRTKALNACGP